MFREENLKRVSTCLSGASQLCIIAIGRSVLRVKDFLSEMVLELWKVKAKPGMHQN